VGKPEGKRPLRRLRRRWVDNVKMDLGEIRMGWCGLVWTSGSVARNSDHLTTEAVRIELL
jgi:hypothetical protein